MACVVVANWTMVQQQEAAAACAMLVTKRFLRRLHNQIAQRVMASKCLLVSFPQNQAGAHAAVAE